MPVSRHWPKRAPKGDFSATCDICGVLWRRSELTRKADGLLYCPDDVAGRDTVTLNDLNARAAEAIGTQERVFSGGSIHTDSYADVVDVATVVGDVTFGRQGEGGG